MSTEKSSGETSPSPMRQGLVERMDSALQKVEGWSIFLILVMLVALTFFQVVLRNLPGNPSITWIDLASRLFVLWVGLLGASLAVAREKHISIDIASRLLPRHLLKWVHGATGFLSLIVLLVLVHASLCFTIVKHEAASLPLFTIDALDLKVFEWFFTDLVPVIFLVMLWHAWVRWRRDIGGREGIARWVALGTGGAALLVLLLIVVADLSLSGLTPVISGAESTLGALLNSWPYFFFILSVFLALLGAPLFVVIGAVALIGHYALEHIPVQNFVADGIGGFRKSTIFLAIPLFTLAGYLMAEGNTPKRLVGLFRGFLGWMPGGVAIVALIACSFFTAFTGASGVTIIALGGLLLPILLEDKYSEKFALGLLTTGGSRGLIFPPAIPVFLLAMIMGLSWDAVTATGPFGSAVMPLEQRQALTRAEIERKRQELAEYDELSAGDEAREADLDALLEQRLRDAGVEGTEPVGGDDEFELGDDDSIGVAEAAGDDEFELGDDDSIGVADNGDEGPDEFELGDDDSIGSEAEEPEAVGTLASGAVRAPPDGVAEPQVVKPVVADEPQMETTIVVPSSTQIFTAGLLPGLLMVLAIAVYCIFMGFSSSVVRTPFTIKGAGRALVSARWELPIPVIIGVGIFGGFFTPAEAASTTAAYTLLMQLVLYRDFGLKTLRKTFVDSMVLVGGILIILVAAMGLLNFLVVAKVPDTVLSMIENLVPERLPVLGLFSIPRKITFLLMLNLFLLVVGCLMDIFSAILVVLPLLLPIAYRFGIHPAHLAVIFLTNLEIGYSTPPVGLNLFIASLRFDRPVVKLYAASLAFLAIMFAGLLVITYWPGLSLWLVNVTGVQ